MQAHKNVALVASLVQRDSVVDHFARIKELVPLQGRVLITHFLTGSLRHLRWLTAAVHALIRREGSFHRNVFVDLSLRWRLDHVSDWDQTRWHRHIRDWLCRLDWNRSNALDLKR